MSTLRTCEHGHHYHKTTDCPTCPVCENISKPDSGFLALIGAPARRALQNQSINTLEQIATWTKSDLLKLHGIGPKAMGLLEECMKETGLEFKP